MNVIEFLTPSNNKNLAFCISDDIESYHSQWTKELIKNLADYTISNLYHKGFDVFVGLDEDVLLNYCADKNYRYCVIISPGTEFINGSDFFNFLKAAIDKDFFIMGHVLDRKDAYYELHHQCFVVNLEEYKKLNRPTVGKQTLGEQHQQVEPMRSMENIHDDYTPLYVSQGNREKIYQHKCHGWNIISQALKNNKSIIVFNNDLRNSKKHHYPESKKDFENKLSWLYFRKNYCATEFVHTSNTEYSVNINEKFDQVIIPASGTLYLDLIDQGTVIFYDYNQHSLDYWKQHCPKNEKIKYVFVKTDLLIDDSLISSIDKNAKNTFINLSNIFCYEGTAVFYPLSYRLKRENEIIENLKAILKNKCKLNFSMRASSGFADLTMIEDLENFQTVHLSNIKKPSWHFNKDWN